MKAREAEALATIALDSPPALLLSASQGTLATILGIIKFVKEPAPRRAPANRLG